jgi:peptidoglycan/LPS O-acetylase OafA/YrhL
VGLLTAFVVYDWWAATPVRFGLSRDFLLNRHRTPRGATLFWIFGHLFVGLGAMYWVMAVRHRRLRWLVVLGQTALFLYFIHQVIVLTLVNQWLHWRFNEWPRFWLANAVFMIVLVGLGWAWRELRPHLRAWRRLPFISAARTGSAS